MKLTMQSLHLLAILALAVSSQAAPLRGTRRASVNPLSAQQRRRVMEDKVPVPEVEVTLFPAEEETLSPTEFPTALPVEDTKGLISGMPSADSLNSTSSWNFTDSPTEAPTTLVETPPPTAPLPPNGRRLYPFSIRFEGNLDDEVAFRTELELYMLSSMKQIIPSLQDIALQSAPLAFGQRSLQQASLLGYQGAAFLDAAVLLEREVPTTEDVQNAQFDTLEVSSAGALQDYLDKGSSSQKLTILQVQVSDFDPIAYEKASLNTGAAGAQTEDEDDNSTTAIIIGVVVGLVVVFALVGFCVWHQHIKPPPPPPYEFDHNENDMSVDDIVEINQTLKVAITESTTDSDGCASPQSQSPGDSPENKKDQDGGMEVIALNSAKRGVIDLSKPAKNSKGIESVMKEKEAPPNRAPVGPEDGDLDSTFDSVMDIRTVVSNEEESMAGFSLTDGPEPETSVKNPAAPKRLLDAWAENHSQKNRGSAELEDKTQLRWFYKGPKGQQQLSKQSETTLDMVSNPLRDSLTGLEKETEVFMDDDDDEIEVISRASEDYPSSYKEDDSIRDGSVLSEMSDGGFVDHVYGSPGRTDGALGYFYREQDEEFEEDFDVLPPRATTRTTGHNLQDDISDVPSDERNNDPKADQDLTGFSKLKALHYELDGITGTRTPDYRGDASPQEGIWEDNPEMMEAWIRERRRIKRQARSRRAERKQPPLTMEI